MEKSLAKISKLLSYVLRHRPDSIGLELNAEGWASILELIDKSGIKITRELINDVVNTNDKNRFTISSDGLYIRANQGHSINIDLGLHPIQPPKELYHGTAIQFISSIKKNGLLSKNRQHVHLTENKNDAIKVGQRHGKPTLLLISAQIMHEEGYKFFKAKNDIWLTNNIPSDFISIQSQSLPDLTKH